MNNITRYQHSVIRGANFPISGRIAPGYRGSPLLSYSPPQLKPESKTIFCVDFSDGVPKDLGRFNFMVTESGTPSYKPNSLFNGLSLYIPAGTTTDICYIAADSKFQVSFPISLESWIWLDEVGSAVQTIVSAAESGNYLLEVSSSGYLTFQVRIGASWRSVAATSVIATRAWVYVAGVYDGRNLCVYEGTARYTSAQVGRITIVDQAVAFGAEPVGETPTFADPLRGYIVGVQLLRRAKSQQEVERYLIGV